MKKKNEYVRSSTFLTKPHMLQTYYSSDLRKKITEFKTKWQLAT